MKIYIIAPFIEARCYEQFQKNEKEFNPGQKFYTLFFEGLCENHIDVEIYSFVGIKKSKYLVASTDSRFHYFYVGNKIERKSVACQIADKICERIDTKNDVVLADGEAYWTMRAALFARNTCKCKVIELITDFPHHVYSYSQEAVHDNIIKKLLRYANAYYKLLSIKKADAYVLLTEGMTDVVGKKKPYVVIEGFSQNNKNCVNNVERFQGDSRSIVYVGSLNGQSGIIKFAHAFLDLSPNNYQLIIYGAGEARSEIEKLQSKFSNIKYGGVISLSEVANVEMNATLLVNPRPSKGDYNRYSFPSKTLEYLSSGTPMMSTKLEGIPNDYDKYIFWLDDSSEEKMRDSLKSVLDLSFDEFEKRGNAAKRFVILEKSPKRQTDKMIQMVRKILYE